MYKLLLILKYLRRRRIAWISLIAVTLCTMMVLVIISVMGGWLRKFENSFRGLTGDIVVDGNSMQGFGHYDEMITEIKKVPGVQAAIPVIESFGLINIDNRKTVGVQVMGLDIDRVGEVNGFPQTLWRNYGQYVPPKDAKISKDERAAAMKQADEAAKKVSWEKPFSAEEYRRIIGWEAGKSRGKDPATWPSMIMGAGVLEIRRNEKGEIVGRDDFKLELPVKLTVLGLGADFSIDMGNKAERTYWIVDDSRTQTWQYDNSYVYVPFDQLQADLGMNEQKYTDKKTGEERTIAARASEIHVRVKPGYDLIEVRKQIEPVVARVIEAHREEQRRTFSDPTVQTWEEATNVYLGQIRKEKGLMVFLFSIISAVAVFLILCIFYMIVSEKTRDIGIIKSVGARAPGVAGIFIGYGLTIGLLGALSGLLLGWLIVKYINEIHTWIGEQFKLTLYNPEVYMFDELPNTMDWNEVAVIVAVAILSSVIGALYPAIRAARMNPVEALRWE